MPPRVRLGRTHGRSNTPRHEIQAGADLSPSQPALRRSRKFTTLTEFCKRLLLFPCYSAVSSAVIPLLIPRNRKPTHRKYLNQPMFSRRIFAKTGCAELFSSVAG